MEVSNGAARADGLKTLPQVTWNFGGHEVAQGTAVPYARHQTDGFHLALGILTELQHLCCLVKWFLRLHAQRKELVLTAEF